MNTILLSHYIPVDMLRTDDFSGFYEGRKGKLIEIVENVMGKSAQRDQSGANYEVEA